MKLRDTIQGNKRISKWYEYSKKWCTYNGDLLAFNLCRTLFERGDHEKARLLEKLMQDKKTGLEPFLQPLHFQD